MYRSIRQTFYWCWRTTEDANRYKSYNYSIPEANHNSKPEQGTSPECKEEREELKNLEKTSELDKPENENEKTSEQIPNICNKAETEDDGKQKENLEPGSSNHDLSMQSKYLLCNTKFCLQCICYVIKTFS